MKRVRAVAVLSACCLAAGCGGGGGDGGLEPAGPHTDYHAVAVVDLNGDGYDDIVAARAFIDPAGADSDAVDVFLRDPAAPTTFLAKASYPIAATPYGVAVGDLNGDDLPDVIVSCTFAESGFRVLLQRSTGGGVLNGEQLVTTSAAVYDMVAVDVDQDGLQDVVAAMKDSLVLVTQKTAAPGTFNAPTSIGAGSQRVAAADFDGNNLVDLVAPVSVGGSSGAVYYLHDAAVPGTFLAGRTVRATHTVTDAAAADLDGDGQPDIALAGVNGGIGNFDGEWTVFVQQPHGLDLFQLAHDYDMADSIDTRVVVGDVDQDGSADVVLGSRTSANKPRTVDVYRHDAGSQFAYDARYTIPKDQAKTIPELYSVALADMNDDGLPDIVVSTNEIFYLPQIAGSPGKFGAAVRVAGQ